MATETQVYTIKDKAITWLGRDLSSGGATDGDMISITFPNDAASVTTGLGAVALNDLPNSDVAEVTLRLLQTSPVNTELQSILNAAKAANIFANGPLTVKDPSGTLLFVSAAAAIKKIPDLKFGKEAQPREWVFICGTSEIIGGGQ